MVQWDLVSSFLESLPPPDCKKHKWDRADWPAFSIQIATEFIGSREIWQELHNHLNRGNLDNAATQFRDRIQMACKQHIPDRKPSLQAKSWWNKKRCKVREPIKPHAET